MFGQPTTVKEAADAAERATKAGRYIEAEALIERAKAIKAGPQALAAFERQAAAAMFAPEYAAAIRAERAQDRRINLAMVKAFKAESLAEIDPDAEKLANELHGGNYAQAAYDKHVAYVKYLKGAQLDTVREEADAVILSPTQILEAVQSGMDAAAIKATFMTSQDSQGGFLTAGVISEQVLGRAATLSVVRQRATVDSPGQGEAIGFPVWQGSGDVYPTGLRGYWTSETQSMANLEENPTIGLVKPPINLWRLKVRASKSLFEDAGARLVGNLNRKFAETIAVEEDREELVGSGAGVPLGVFASSNGVLVTTGVRVVNSGAANTLTADGVINMIFSLPVQYRNAPGFASTCNAATLKAIRLLKDGAGRYLYNEDTGRLCGYALAESESMPDIAAGAYPLGCGDFAGYAIADKVGLSVTRYDDSGSADTDSVVFYIRRRLGGTPAEPYRFAAMKVAS